MPRNWTAAYQTINTLAAGGDDLVANGAIYPRWINDGNAFWYDRQTDDDVEFRLVEAVNGDNRVIVSRAELTRHLSKALDLDLDPSKIVLRNMVIQTAPLRLEFQAAGRNWEYNVDGASLGESAFVTKPSLAFSPDGKFSIVVRNSNLHLQRVSGDNADAVTALTTDGSEFNAYASRPASTRGMTDGLGIDRSPEGLWSPDSRWFFTLQTDDREVPDLPVMSFVPREGVRPTVSANRTSLPGDPRVTEFRMLAVEAATGRQVEARYPRITASRMNDTPFSAGLAWWSADSRRAYFVDIERGETTANVIEFDIATGATRVVFSETAESSLDLSSIVYATALVLPLPGTGEVVWYSERDGRGHLYLYDLESGEVTRQLTSGAWQVREVLHVDEARREVALLAGGLDPELDPYLRTPCVVSLDHDGLTVLSEDASDHIVWRANDFALSGLSVKGVDPSKISGFSPNGNYFVETVGAVDRLPYTVLRDRTGQLITVVETATATGLPAEWSWPKPFTVLAADGTTSVYGLLFHPAGYEPGGSYPVIDLIYGGPQVSNVPKSAFTDEIQNGTFLEAAGYAQLGAFVLVLDGRGTAGRERSFRKASYGAVHTASNLEDHIAGIQQLAERTPGMDLTRVGITGFSGGGYMTAIAALRYGDFFKVAVAGGGNYDQALFWHSWGERYHGPFDPESYAQQAAKTYAAGLTGKLMLIHGLEDSGCHPAALFQLLQALEDANKDVDLVLSPTAPHALTGYAMRRRIDYFVTHLLGSTPPQNIALTGSWDRVMQMLAQDAELVSAVQAAR